MITATEAPQYSFLGGQETFFNSYSVSIRKSADNGLLIISRLVKNTIPENKTRQIIIPLVIVNSKKGNVYLGLPQNVGCGGVMSNFSAGTK